VLSTPGLGGALTSGGGLQPLVAPGGAMGMNQTPGAGQAGQPTNPAANANPLESQPQPLDGVVMGGNIIGVGSKIEKPSLRVYLGGDTYQQWEFIWNPTGQTALPAQAPVNPNANPTSTPAPNGAQNPGSPDGQQPQQNPQMPVVNVTPPSQ
jgi:hypothetical protein